MKSAGFTGFPDGPVSMTPVPEGFFTELLAKIDHLGELKLALYALRLLSRQTGKRRFLTRSGLQEDPVLRAVFPERLRQASAGLDDAIERLVARGVLLSAKSGEEYYFFLNSPRGRESVQALLRGAWNPGGEKADSAPERESSNVYTLYEQNIGPLTPLIADLIRDAEREYSAEWVEKAIRVAVERNARHWRYIAAVLDRWRREGLRETGGSERERRKYVEGEYADYIKH